MGIRQLADRDGLSRRPPDLDRRDLAADPRDLGVGTLQTGRPRRALRDHLHPRRLRAGGQRGDRNIVGDLIHLIRAINNVVMSLFGAPTPSGLPISLQLVDPDRGTAARASGCSTASCGPTRSCHEQRPHRLSQMSRSSTARSSASTGSPSRSNPVSPVWSDPTVRARAP